MQGSEGICSLASTPLHMLFPLLGMPFPSLPHLACPAFQSPLRNLLQEVFPHLPWSSVSHWSHEASYEPPPAPLPNQA